VEERLGFEGEWQVAEDYLRGEVGLVLVLVVGQ
jgi:hypothetical protein